MDPQSEELVPMVVFPRQGGESPPWTPPLLTKPCVQLVLDTPTATMGMPHIGWDEAPSLGVFSSHPGMDGVGGFSQLARSALVVVLHLVHSPAEFFPSSILKNRVLVFSQIP